MSTETTLSSNGKAIKSKTDNMVDISQFDISSVYVQPDYVSVTSKDGRSLNLTKGREPNTYDNSIYAVVLGTFFGYGAAGITGIITDAANGNPISKYAQLAIGSASGLAAAYKWYHHLNHYDKTKWIDMDEPVQRSYILSSFANFFVHSLGLATCIIGGYQMLKR